MVDGSVHVQPLAFGLLAGNDHVDQVAASQALIRNHQQSVGVRRQVDPDDVGFLVHHMIDESRILVREAIVVLAPDM
ncbi:hypothetical protein SDC9_173810 [bioreactor metagenome]|uniref:Uncharacterized protein n=1 Tax=bioreactor metagenome TaxID=1076179 RepID=A0A645GJH5_9ZZZZ